MYRQLHKIFLKGLAVVAPLLITCYVIYWLASTLESLLGRGVKLVLPDKYYVPGVGLAIGIALIFAIGLLFQTWLVKWIWHRAERLLDRIPLVKTIYGAVRDLTDFMNRSASEDAKRVVLVTMPGSEMKLMGFVTRDDFRDVPDALGTEETVAVYLPMSYQLGGFTVMIPQANVEPIDMDMEQAMRFALTGGMVGKR